jgi:hypothetical protein
LGEAWPEPLGLKHKLRHIRVMAPAATLLTLLAGAAAGALATRAWLFPRLQAQLAAAETLRAQLDQASAAQVHLAEMHAQLSVLRHDLHGILSPALLSADRLTSNADPAIRKTGEIVIRTVERATARLAETKGGHEAPKHIRP